MKRGFSRREAALYIGCSYSWLAKKAMRKAEDPGYPGPRFIKAGGKRVLYLKEDLDQWLEHWGSDREQFRPAHGSVACDRREAA